MDLAKEEVKKGVIEMSENVGNVRDRLLIDAQEIRNNARKFQKDAKELETQAQSRDFWSFSPKCVGIGAGVGGLGVLVIWLIRAFILK